MAHQRRTGDLWRSLKLLPGAGAGVVHGFLTALQVIQQRAVWRWELAAIVLAWLEQAAGAPTVQGPLTHAQAISCLALDGPVRGCGHWRGCEEQELLGARRSAIDPSTEQANRTGCVQ